MYDLTMPGPSGDPHRHHKAAVEQPAWAGAWGATFEALTTRQQAEFARTMLDAAEAAGDGYHPVHSRPAK